MCATRVKVVAKARVAVGASAPSAPTSPGSYFSSSEQRVGLEFISTGCAVLDQVMGGGYVLGRMSNVIGDKSTGKTLLAIEAAGNFARRYEDGVIRYLEAESAFDKEYARAMGLPVDRVEWAEMVTDKGDADRTVEWLHDDIVTTLAKLKGRPCIYIVDSLDALSDRAEMERDISDSSYGAAKAKKLGEMFRRLVGDIEKSRMLLLVISQIRDKIGVTFGENKMRSGGHAMDFYATHCLWLAQIGTLKKTVQKIERPIGVSIRAKCKKNKVGIPFRECDFPLLFGYGVDDLTANTEWLLAAGKDDRLTELGMSKAGYKVRITSLRDKGGAELAAFRKTLNAMVMEEWSAVEMTFLPKASKY